MAAINYIPYSVRLRIKNVPVLRGLQRWLIVRFLSNWSFVHTIDAGPAAGLRFDISLPADKPIWAGTYESKFATAITKNMKPGDVCYDIGGHRGYMSGVMAFAGAAKIFVFEPLPANQCALRRLCNLNPQLPIAIIAAALGNIDESALLKVMPDSSMGKLTNSSFQPNATAVEEIPVAVRRIDSLVEKGEVLPPDVLKVDVEGSEVDVIAGALQTCQKSRPKIFLEVHGSALEETCSQMLSQLGYEIRRIESEIASDESTRHLVCLP